MSIAALVRGDNRNILTNDGERITTLTSPGTTPAVYSNIPCLHFRRGIVMGSDGVPIVGDSANMTISLAELTAIGLIDPETLKVKGWTCIVNGVSYKLDEAPIDYTMGVVTITLKKVTL